MKMVMQTGKKTEKEGKLLENARRKEEGDELSNALEKINKKLDLIIEMGKSGMEE